YLAWPLWAKISAPIAVLALLGSATSAIGGRDDTRIDAGASSVTVGTTTTVPSGMFAECKDGSFSDNPEFSKTCSSHKGVARWLEPYVRCKSGDVVALN